MTAVAWQRVTSSNVRRVGWLGTSEPGTLWVQFGNGGVYRYDGVPEAVYTGLLAAPSKGAFVARQVRERYPTTREVPRRPELDEVAALGAPHYACAQHGLFLDGWHCPVCRDAA